MGTIEHNKTAVMVRNACKSYGNKPILNQLNMHVETGTIYGLLGASGCGKTTLLSCIVGRKKLDSGGIWTLGGEPGTPESGIPGPRVGYMPQDVALVAEFTVKGAIFYFGRIFGMTEPDIEQRYQELSKLLELPPDDRFIKNCSGGQQRRVSFAASMVSMPELLILDEPTVGLDPLLRERIWNYLVEIAEAKNIAVVITTHYIEETKQAHKIGLMRQGRLLAEDSPANLLNAFRTESLEEVFLMLSRRQTDMKLQETNSENAIQDSTLSLQQESMNSVAVNDFNSSKDVLTPQKSKKKQPTSFGTSFNFQRMKALFAKNTMQIARNPSGLGFMMVFPILEMLAFFLAIGNDVRDIKIGLINEEHSDCSKGYLSNNTALPYDGNRCNLTDLGCRFLEVAEDPMIDLVPYDNVPDALDGITHGDVAGAVYIPKSFSKALQEKMHTNFEELSLFAINFSHIQTWLDMSNRQIGTTVKYKLVDKLVDFWKAVHVDCNFEEKVGAIPINFVEDIYGHSYETFRVFMIPGVLLTIMFFMGTTNTSTVIITDRLEGVWDRSIVAGVSSLEILLTHFVTQLALVIIQTCIVLIFAFVFYNTEFLGNFGIIILLVILQGTCGMAFGFWISVVSNSHSMANIVTCGSFYPMILLCGLVWPLEGMPIGLQWIAKCLPFTIPIISLRNVIKKGWSLIDMEVLNGVGIEIVWIIFLGVVSTLELKRKR